MSVWEYRWFIANVLHPFATRSNSSFAALLLDVVGVPLAFDLLQDIATTKDYAEIFSPDEGR
jgi:hypothetical protein